MGAIKNVFGLMTIELDRMASRAFELNTSEIPKAGLGKIRGSKPQIARTMAVPSCIDDGAGPTTMGNARTRVANPPMAGEVCLFPEFDDPESVGDSTISLMTTKEGGAGVTWPRRFNKYSYHSFFDPTDIALHLAFDWTI